MSWIVIYDDPKTTPKEKCRSFVGNIIEQKDCDKIKFIEAKGLKIDSIPNEQDIVAEFPLKNMISYMIGPMKVYPEFSKYIIEKKYKPTLSFEIYNNTEKKIVFVMQYE